MKKRFGLGIFILALLLVPFIVFGTIQTWSSTGVTLEHTITMPSPYEPSGLAWNELTEKLFVVSDPTNQGNKITMMDIDGSNPITWEMIGGSANFDFEALTIVDPTNNYIYVGVENEAAIKEFDLTSPTDAPRITKTWDLDPWLNNLGSAGMEGLTYIPDGFHPYENTAEHAVFYAGLQRRPDIEHNTPSVYDDDLIYAFDVNLDVDGDVRYLGHLELDYSQIPVFNLNIADLYFSKDTGTLFVLFGDNSSYLYELSPDGATVINRYSGVPGGDREGVLVKTTPMSDTAEIFLAFDNSRKVERYSGFPVTYPELDSIGELGRVSVMQESNSQWHTVELENTYVDPVVIMQIETYNGSHASHIRLRNVTENSFEFQIEEWDYLDQWHTTEDVSYVVMESGSYEVNGVKFGVGKTILNHNFKTVTYGVDFEQVPVVLSQSQTYNGGQAVVTRQKNISTSGFEVRLHEEENNDNWHLDEEVGYIAIDKGQSTLGNAVFNADFTGDSVTHKWQQIDFSTMNDPVFFSMMQTYDGGDTAGMRHRNLSSGSVEVMIEEEQSKDSEKNHTTEVVGYLVLDGIGKITTR